MGITWVSPEYHPDIAWKSGHCNPGNVRLSDWKCSAYCAMNQSNTFVTLTDDIKPKLRQVPAGNHDIIVPEVYWVAGLLAGHFMRFPKLPTCFGDDYVLRFWSKSALARSCFFNFTTSPSEVRAPGLSFRPVVAISLNMETASQTWLQLSLNTRPLQ